MMKHKRMLGLLSAMTLAVTSVPVQLAAALDPDAGMDENVVYQWNYKDGFFVEHNQRGREFADSELNYTEEGRFTASWEDADAEKESLFLCGKLTDTAEKLEDLGDLTVWQNIRGRIEGTGCFGYRTRFVADSSAEYPTMIDCYVVDGFGEWRPVPEGSEKRGEITASSGIYDVYLLDEENFSGRPVTVTYAPQTVQECWIVRRESTVALDQAFEYQAEIDLKNMLLDVKAMDVDLNEWCETALFVSAQTGSGSFEAVSNDMSIPFDDGCQHESLNETGVTEDGYAWYHSVQAPYVFSKLEPGGDGAFTCFWREAKDAYYTVGRELTQPADPGQDTHIRYDYELGFGFAGQIFTGIAGRGVYGDRTAEFYIIDGWSGTQSPIASLCWKPIVTKLGTITVDDAEYDVYKAVSSQISIEGIVPAPTYYSVRKENLRSAESYAYISNSVDVSAHVQAFREFGFALGDLTGIGVVVEAAETEADGITSGMAARTKNQLILPGEKPDKNAQPKPNVKGDANCDGLLDVADVVLIARVINEDAAAGLSDQGRINGDADGKNGLNADDVTFLLQVIAKKIKI